MSTDNAPNSYDSTSKDVEPFRCEECGTPFTTGDELRRHAQLTHRIGEKGSEVTMRTGRTRQGSKKRKSVKLAKEVTTKKKSKTAPKKRAMARKTDSKKR